MIVAIGWSNARERQSPVRRRPAGLVMREHVWNFPAREGNYFRRISRPLFGLSFGPSAIHRLSVIGQARHGRRFGLVGESGMNLQELVAKEHLTRNCQECDTKFTDKDLVDYYCKVCQTCFAKWSADAGVPLRRYGKPSKEGLCVCVPCGMMFSSTSSFDEHRRGMRCHSPAEMLAGKRKLVVKDGVWTYPSSQTWQNFVERKL